MSQVFVFPLHETNGVDFMEIPECPDGSMFQGLSIFPGEVHATRDVMVVKETVRDSFFY